MTPATFPEVNASYAPPRGFEESQIVSLDAYHHQVQGGSCDGCAQVVVAWRPNQDELLELMNGGLIYISMMGGLAPHYPSVNFHAATHPA